MLYRLLKRRLTHDFNPVPKDTPDVVGMDVFAVIRAAAPNQLVAMGSLQGTQEVYSN